MEILNCSISTMQNAFLEVAESFGKASIILNLNKIHIECQFFHNSFCSPMVILSYCFIFLWDSLKILGTCEECRRSMSSFFEISSKLCKNSIEVYFFIYMVKNNAFTFLSCFVKYILKVWYYCSSD